jgi:hypothetical protein
LRKKPHASAVARASKGKWSYATVWRVADRWKIPLTAGRETMGRPRLSVEQRQRCGARQGVTAPAAGRGSALRRPTSPPVSARMTAQARRAARPTPHSSTFEQACASAEHTAGVYESRGQLRMWPLTKLRVELGIIIVVSK